MEENSDVKYIYFYVIKNTDVIANRYFTDRVWFSNMAPLKQQKQKGWDMKSLAIASELVIILMTAGTMDFNDELSQEAHYCSMVAGGAWPAYNGAVECAED